MKLLVNATFSLFVIFGLLITCFAPLYHNSDGSYYYGVALLLSHGQFSASVDGLYAPLLSWFMAPLVWAAIPIFWAFRIVNFCAFLATLIIIKRIALVLRLSETVTALSIALVGGHLCYFVVALITSDLLSVPFFLYSILIVFWYLKEPHTYLLYLSGMFGALAYYAKPILLITYIVSIVATFTLLALVRAIPRKLMASGILKCVLTCVMLSAPWIVVLSLRYEKLVFTGQQLILTHPNSRFDYSPLNYGVFNVPDRNYDPETQEKIKSTGPLPRSHGENILFALSYLYQSAGLLLFGEVGVWFYLIVLSIGVLSLIRDTFFDSRTETKNLWVVLSIFTFVHVTTHVWIWGPYIRYFFPILPFLHIIFINSLSLISKKLRKMSQEPRRYLAAQSSTVWFILCCLCLSSIFFHTISNIIADWRDRVESKQDELMECATKLPILKESSGVVTGPLDSMYPALISYHLNRLYWNSIDPKRGESTTLLRERLLAWNVGDVIWFGEINPKLNAVEGLGRTGPYCSEFEPFYIYSFRQQSRKMS